MLTTIFAFIKRDFLQNKAYSFAFSLRFAGIFFTTMLWFFISRIFSEMNLSYLKEYKGDYFSFVIIGIVVSRFLTIGVNSFSNFIKYEQVSGTLEAMLTTATKVSAIMLSSVLWVFIIASIDMFFCLSIAAIFLKANIVNGNFFPFIAISLLSYLIFSGIGIMSASFVIVFKRGDPINMALNFMFTFFGGVYYPITVLPAYLQKISCLLPITYSLNAMRNSLIKGYAIKDLYADIIPLFIFLVVIMPCSIIIFNRALKKAKTDGSLTHF